MWKAYPRHSVDISAKEHAAIFAWPLRPHPASLVGDLEAAFRGYIGVPYAVTMPSARLGLAMLFEHFALPPGSEIIMTPFTHWSIFAVIKASGLKPVFADIDPSTFNIDPVQVRKAISKNTRALILTHMWGQACDMAAFMDLKREFDLKVIEDCAMACGATYAGAQVGSFGDAAIFSFGKAKAIAAFGGGMLCTRDAGIHEAARRYTATFTPERPLTVLANVASSVVANILTRPRMFYVSIYPVMRLFHIRDPYNPLEHRKDAAAFLDHLPMEWKRRMAPLQAAIAMEQLRTLDARNAHRAAHARRLNALIDGARDVVIPSEADGARHIYLYYALLVRKRTPLDDIRQSLLSRGVDTQLNELTSARELAVFGADSRDYPVFHEVSTKLLVIPNGIYLDDADIQYVGKTVRQVLDACI
jgi:dTDP-4-amino-4,6-dideoxygalactose transaminase